MSHRKQYTVAQKALILASAPIAWETDQDEVEARNALVEKIREVTGRKFWTFLCSKRTASFIGTQYANRGKDIDLAFTSRYLSVVTGMDTSEADECVAEIVEKVSDPQSTLPFNNE